MQAMDDALLSPVVRAARDELQNPRMLSDRIAVGRALWRELVIGFAQQLGSLDLGFTQLAALYAVAGPVTLTVADLAEQLGRSPQPPAGSSAASWRAATWAAARRSLTAASGCSR